MEDDQDETSKRHRSPSFYDEEIKVLLNLINEFKKFILNKSTTSSACRAKDLAWIKITDKYNSHGFKNVRSIDVLKNKWKNLVTHVKKQSKNLLNANEDDVDEFSSQIITLINDEDKHYSSEVFLPDDLEDISKDEGAQIIRNNSMNFKPQEIRLLLSCVNAEKKYVFLKDSSKFRQLKDAAWTRITEQYNRQSNDGKRSTLILQKKFLHMKNRVHRFRILKNKRRNHATFPKVVDVPNIKPEPLFELKDEFNGNGDKSDSEDNFEGDAFKELKAEDPDPLSTVLNSDSGLGSSINLGSFNPFENNEVVKLKMELLKYKIENAKLKKTRLENAIQADAKLQQQTALEKCMRLRTARLEAAAAELKLPTDHPALEYTTEEMQAEAYLKQRT